MAQLDDIVGSVMQKLKDMGVDENTIVMFTTDNGTENFTWPDGGQTPFYGGKGTGYEGGFPRSGHDSPPRGWIGTKDHPDVPVLNKSKRSDCFVLSGTCIGPLEGVTKSNAGETSPHYGLASQIHIRSMA
jgi:hypothetical protein